MEFALVVPVLLLLLLLALDFGRVYLGYINLQNLARIAANYAANNPSTDWADPLDPKVISFRNQIVSDARATNCTLPQVAGITQVPTPSFTDVGGNGTSTDIGDTVAVSVTCTFRILTPVISSLFSGNGDLPVTASAVFPVKTGLTATSGGTAVPPAAAFTASPLTGSSPLVVQFTDQSAGLPTSWAWDFDQDGIAESTAQNPQFTFSSAGLYSVTLVVTNETGSDTLTKSNYISVASPPAVISFTADPTSGPRPLTVQFTDTSTGAPTAWAWDFDNDGVVDSTEQNPSHTYAAAGTYTVSLTATNAGGPATLSVPNMITVTVGTCVVPNLAGSWSYDAPGVWSGAGFTGQVNYQQGNLPWVVKSQNRVVGQALPCDTTVTVSKN